MIKTRRIEMLTRDGITYSCDISPNHDGSHEIAWCTVIGKRGKPTKQYRLAIVRNGVIGELGTLRRI